MGLRVEGFVPALTVPAAVPDGVSPARHPLEYPAAARCQRCRRRHAMPGRARPGAETPGDPRPDSPASFEAQVDTGAAGGSAAHLPCDHGGPARLAPGFPSAAQWPSCGTAPAARVKAPEVD